MRAETKTQTPKPKLTAVKRVMDRLDKSRYQVLRMVGAGELEAETVDGHLVIKTDSLERYEAAARS
jgi:hypothetical protein